MNSHLTGRFRELFRQLPQAVQESARRAYRLWHQDPSHPSLQFKKIHATKPIYSVRVGLAWRAVGVLRSDTMIWYWIGSHADYERLISHS